MGHGLVSYNGKLWVLGGRVGRIEIIPDGINTRQTTRWSMANDVWSSPDGEEWTFMGEGEKFAGLSFKPARAFATSFVWKNKI